jgi:mercuric ion transport protein
MPFLNAKRSLIVGVLAAIGASVCCVGPLILLLLGIGGAWVGNLVSFEPYRPIFIGVTFVFLGLAFRKLYWASRECAPDSACASATVLQRQRLVFWLITILTLCLLALPQAASLFL